MIDFHESVFADAWFDYKIKPRFTYENFRTKHTQFEWKI